MLSRENSAPADDPMSRLEFCKSEIDRLFGRGFSRDHPELTAAVMLSASMDFAGRCRRAPWRRVPGATAPTHVRCAPTMHRSWCGPNARLVRRVLRASE
jgi:hypothetical protein